MYIDIKKKGGFYEGIYFFRHGCSRIKGCFD